MSDTTTDLSVEDRIGLYFQQPNALYRESPHDLLRLAMYELGNKDRRIESIQRENAALRDVLDRRGNLSKYVDSGNLLAEQKAAAITPEMRERIERALEIGPGNDPKFSERVFRDLLGEQG